MSGVVVERLQDWPWPLGGHRLVALDDYAGTPSAVPAGARIVNLCRNAGYRARSYECSLLAEERGHAVLPSVTTLTGLNCRTLQDSALDRLSDTLAILLEEHPSALERCRPLLVAFGRAADPRLLPLAARAFHLFPCPLLLIEVDGRSRCVTGVRAATGRDVGTEVGALFRDGLDGWLRAQPPPPSASGARYRVRVTGDAPYQPLGLNHWV